MAQLQTQQQQQVNPVFNGTSDEEVDELRYKLAQARKAAEQAQKDIENLSLKAPSSVDAFADASAEETSPSVAEQVKQQVDAIRLELETRHDERVNQLEETYKKRTDTMRNQLTKKLAEGKDQMRQAMLADHEQNLDALRASHRQELDQLDQRHQDEIAELRRNEESTFARFKETWLREHPIAAPEAEHTLSSEDQTATGPWKPTEAEAREFVSTNTTVRSILRSNITTKVKEAKDALTIELKEEHERITAQRLKEVQEKADLAKEHAVYTEGKRFALKLNLADNRSKVAQAKLEVVQKAAQETPEKPVGEVWAVAKDAKPPVQTNAPITQMVPRNTVNFGQPTSTGPKSPQAQSSPQHKNPGSTTFTEARDTLQHTSNTETTDVSSQPQDSPHPATLAVVSPTERPTPVAQLANVQPASSQSGSQSSLPVKLQPNNNQQQASIGSAPGTGRGLQQSGLPIARGGLSRGVPHPRGRGQGIGRGGAQTLDNSKAQGNKRTRDDSQDGQHGGDEGNGKRIRGGSAGS